MKPGNRCWIPAFTAIECIVPNRNLLQFIENLLFFRQLDFHDQRQVVGGNTRKLRVRYVDLDHQDSGIHKDVIDACPWIAAKPGLLYGGERGIRALTARLSAIVIGADVVFQKWKEVG